MSELVSPTQARDEVEGRLRTAQESCEREEARAAENLEEVRTLYHVPSGQTAASSCAVDRPSLSAILFRYLLCVRLWALQRRRERPSASSYSVCRTLSLTSQSVCATAWPPDSVLYKSA